MKVMVVDGGARGQALGMQLAAEGAEVFISPGNPGNEEFAASTGISPNNVLGQLKFARCAGVDLTIPAADDPLALGIVDAFQENGLTIFGPTQAQARIEWDRDFAKQLARRQQIPTGPYAEFTSIRAAREYARQYNQWPLFVKDNALAGGKGATRCDSMNEYKRAIGSLEKMIVEDYVAGPEASHHAFCDGKTHLSIPFMVRDHKAVGDNDTGPMTGGMGTAGPLPNYAPHEVQELGRTFVEPVVHELGFQGLLFSGLKGPKGHEQNLEWNARPGDPEMQLFLRLMKSDLLPVIMACNEGDLASLPTLQWHLGQSAICLVLAARGYPQKPQRGDLIEGIDEAAKVTGVEILHAGTDRQNSQLVTAGGRVLNIVAVADTLQAAREHAYQAASLIGFGDREPVFRTDIGGTIDVA